MQKTGSSNKINIPELWFQYLKINCAFFVPFIVFYAVYTLFPEISVSNFIGDILGAVFIGYWALFILYYILGLTYLHCVVSLGFLIFCISKLDEEITQKRLSQIFILTAVSIALNIYWLLNGNSFIP